MSPLGKLIRGIRLKHNVSELKAARRLGIPIEDFVAHERHPETLSSSVLYKVFKAIEMSESEYVDFMFIARAMFVPEVLKPQETMSSKSQELSSSEGHIIPFVDSKGIKKTRSDRSRRKSNQKGV